MGIVDGDEDMMKSTNGFCFAVLAMLAASASFAHADDTWSNLGYNKPVPEVEEVPESIPPAYQDTLKSAPVTAVPSAPSDSNMAPDPILAQALEPTTYSKTETSSPSNISTAQNTYGVMTEEHKPVQFYVSPFGGVNGFVGNSTVNSMPGAAIGITGGFLLSTQIMIEASYIHSQQSLSNPLQGSSFSPLTGVFDYKQNELNLGGKLFFLGRESRLRPFFGAGLGYSKSTINYTSAFAGTAGTSTGDYVQNNVNGYGEVGAEFAFTRMIVAQAMFKFDGSISGSGSSDDANAAQSLDTNKLIVGNSLSRTSAYTLAAGLGIYF